MYRTHATGRTAQATITTAATAPAPAPTLEQTTWQAIADCFDSPQRAEAKKALLTFLAPTEYEEDSTRTQAFLHLRALSTAPYKGCFDVRPGPGGQGLICSLSDRRARLPLFSYTLETKDLRHANLAGLDLRGINWQGVNLAGANLNGTDLRGGNLTGANLENALMAATKLEDTDLTEARLPPTLEQAWHAVADCFDNPQQEEAKQALQTFLNHTLDHSTRISAFLHLRELSSEPHKECFKVTQQEEAKQALQTFLNLNLDHSTRMSAFLHLSALNCVPHKVCFKGSVIVVTCSLWSQKPIPLISYTLFEENHQNINQENDR